MLGIGYGWLARGRVGSQARVFLFELGILTIWLALETPLDRIGDHYLQSAHMFQHVLLGLVVPPLLLLGLSPAMARTLLVLFPPLQALTRPIQAQVIAGMVMVIWHVPTAYDLTLASPPVHIFEHLTFVGAGLVFWWPALNATSEAQPRALGEGLKLVYLLAGTFPQDGIALVLQFSHVPFYHPYLLAPRLVATLDPVTDQNLAGAILQLIGKTSYIIAGLAIFTRWMAKEQALIKT